jgi:PKD repeat protein
MKYILSTIFIVLATFIGVSQTAIVTPATQASNVTLSSITTTSMKIDWTQGSGVYEIVVVRPSSSTRVVPLDASMPAYGASSNYGSGSNLGNNNYVVYKGSGSSVTVTGLTPNINYEAVVYSYNYGCGQYLLGTCLQPNVYLVKTSYSTANWEQHLTLAIEPTAAPTISVIGTPGPTNATLSFNGSSTYNLINVYKYGTSLKYPVDGTYYPPSSIFGSGTQIGGTGTNNFSVYSSSANGSVNLTNLPPATAFYAIAYGYNGSYYSSINTSYNYYNGIGYVYFSTYNSPPTINALSNYTICQDAASTVINLSGISKGTNSAETQTVTVAAYSNNTALIPSPTINYSNPNSTGTLTFKPNAGQSGTAVITVVTQDGGPNNNATNITFTVTVKSIPVAAGSISTATTTLCQLKSGVVFSVPTIANATTYNWSLPTGATVTSGVNTNAITVNFNTNVSSTNIKVYGSNTNGCGNGAFSPSLLVNFDKVPTTSIAGPNQQICNNLTALAANTVAVGSGSWTACSSGLFNITGNPAPNANLTVLDNATVTAVWTVTNGVCPSSSSTVTVTNIKGSPSCTPYADFVANKTEACVNSSLLFNNTSVQAVGVNTFTWNFGSGANPATSTSTAQSISVTYSTTGLKTITLAMNSGAGALTKTYTNYINVITIPNAPITIFGNTSICQGKSAEPYFINTVNNATDYTWSFPADVDQNTGTNTNAISANFSTTASSGNIGVYASNSCGSSSVTTLSVTVNPLPTKPTIAGNNTVCQGENSVQYIANNLNYGLSYTWDLPNGANIVSGLNTRTITVDYSINATSGPISVYGTNGCGDGDSRNKSITVNMLPEAAGTISGSISNNICPLSTDINYSITAMDNATDYAWVYPSGYTVVGVSNSNSIMLDATINSVSGGIKVVGKNACGNGDTSSVLYVNIDQLPAQQICVVTVDSSSVHNEIIWQKNGASNVDSFRVYRVQSLVLDTLIGTVDYADLSKLVDVNSDPNVTSYTYKIAAVDFCGNEGPISLPHQTIHLQSIYSPSPQKTDLSWNLYDGALVNNYRVLRDTNNSGNWVVLINSLAPNVTSYTDLNIPVGANSVQYRVDVIWSNSCDPTQRVAQSVVNTSKSNTKDFVISVPTNISSQTELLNSISIYPNPTKDYFNIELKSGLASIDVEIYNQLGSKLQSNHLSYTDYGTIDISQLSAGIYYVCIKTEMGSITKRITKL